MYRLLIVTKDTKAEKMLTSIDSWEAMGFKPPRLRRTAEEAIECMRKHHIHAIAMDETPSFAPLMSFLDENHPSMPIFKIEENKQAQLNTLREVYRLLSQVHSDDSNDDYDEGYYFKLARERWMKKLLSGMAPDETYILSHHKMLRCRESTQCSCLYARLGVPAGDDFLLDRWHYGSDRLEMALRNFFGEERENATLHLAVISPEEVRVLVCPKPDASDDALTAERALRIIEETIEQIDHYLGLPMNIIDIREMESLLSFAAERRQA